MSLYAWKLPLVTDPDEAKRLVGLEDETVFEPSPDVTRFYAELMERLPPPEVAVVAWKLSIPVLTWTLVFVGGFVALVAAFSLVAIAQPAWQARGN